MFISRIRFRNFKSFRYADIPLSKGFVCVAGPNGSGKSNVCDAIRFVLGENSLRSIRAKKISDLINSGADKAEIWLHLEGEKSHELKRAIRNDGKTLYRLDGKRMTRTAVLDALRPYGMEASAHNVIAQGEVERIVQMNPKERREIIDHVAGISEYEQKKKEALKELESVEQKINDATIVLKEREGFLAELEEEKDAAISYTQLKERHRALQGSLIYWELEKVDREHSKAVQKCVELEKKIAEADEALRQIEAKVADAEKAKQEVVRRINELGSAEKSFREVEELKRLIEVNENERKNKQEALKKTGERLASVKEDEKKLEKQLAEFGGEARAWAHELSKIEEKLKALEEKKKALGHARGSLSEKLSQARSELESVSAGIEEKKDLARTIDFEAMKAKELKESWERELARVAGGSDASEKAAGIEKALEKALNENQALSAEMDRLFAEEKQLNASLVEAERQLLSIKEKWATARMAAGREPEGDAVDFIRLLREKRAVQGIHGTVSELCTFDPEYAVAVEASAGTRLNYVVVESVDAATEAIELIKQKRAGRCTFIPLDKKSFLGRQALPEDVVKRSLGLLKDFLKYDAKLEPAFDYVFGNTLVVKDLEHAKKVGIGRARMVSLDGDVVEPSSVITGGFFKSKFALKERKQAEVLEKEIEKIKAEIDRMMGRIEEVRDRMNAKRRARAENEVKAKTLEIELKAFQEKNEARKKIAEQAESSRKRIREAEEVIRKSAGEAEKAAAEIARLEEKRAAAKKALEELEKKASEGAPDELEAETAKFREAKASLEARLGEKKGGMGMLQERAAAMKKEAEAAGAEKKTLEHTIAEVDREIKNDSKQLEEKKKELAATSQKMAKLYGERDGAQKAVESLASEKGRLSAGTEKYREDRRDRETDKRIAEQRLADLKTEFASYGDVKVVEGKKEELQAQAFEAHREMESLGMINERAPEVYEEKKRDLDELKLKVEKLAEEKSAIMLMVEELETKKITIFQETFRKVNENFRKLFGYVFPGEGLLSIDVPADPLSSGLHIKVRKDGKERFIESMSGGERSLLALLFVFSIHMYKPAPFYILDEVEAALDKNNSRKFAELVKTLSRNTQFIVVTHNDAVLATGDTALGVAMTNEGSKIVGVNLTGGKA